MIYTGIGSRETPPEIQEIMTNYARKLDKLGFILRSGGAMGADTAFEKGSTNKEIYLPWKILMVINLLLFVLFGI